MGQNKKAWAITLLVFFALFIGGLYIKDIFFVISSLTLLFVLSSYLLTNNSDKNIKKTRSTAAFCSVYVPGAAHLYLRQYRTSVLFFMGYLLAVGNILLLYKYQSESEVYLIIASFASTILSMYFLSIVDTEVVCNKLNMPYSGDSFELKIKKYSLAYVASILIPFILVLIVFAGITLSGAESSVDLKLLVMGSWTAVLFFCILIKIKKDKR